MKNKLSLKNYHACKTFSKLTNFYIKDFFWKSPLCSKSRKQKITTISYLKVCCWFQSFLQQYNLYVTFCLFFAVHQSVVYSQWHHFGVPVDEIQFFKSTVHSHIIMSFIIASNINNMIFNYDDYDKYYLYMYNQHGWTEWKVVLTNK